MNNDLISREAIKKAIVEMLVKWGDGYSYIETPTDDAIEKMKSVIDNAPTVELDESIIQEALNKRCMSAVANEYLIELHGKRPKGDLIEYKPLDADFNIRAAVENLKTAYWSNEPEKDAKAFSEAEDIIISAICHHGYTVCKESEAENGNCSDRSLLS